VVVGGGLTFAFVGRSLAPSWRAGSPRASRWWLSVGRSAVAAAVYHCHSVGFAVCDVVGRTIPPEGHAGSRPRPVLGAVEGLSFAGLSVGAILAPLLVSPSACNWRSSSSA